MLSSDTQVQPLIQIFELYMLRDAPLTEMREPTMLAARSMLDAGLRPEIILNVLEGAVQGAASSTGGAESAAYVRDLREHIGPWLMGECFDPARAHGDIPPAD